MKFIYIGLIWPTQHLDGTTCVDTEAIGSDYSGNEPASTQYFSRKLSLLKKNPEILAVDMKSLHLLEPGVNLTCFRKHEDVFVPYFSVNESNTFANCNDIEGLVTEMNIEYNTEDWRIFIDSSKKSLKALLLYYDNFTIPIPIAYGIDVKESYDSVKNILDAVKYKEHECGSVVI